MDGRGDYRCLILKNRFGVDRITSGNNIESHDEVGDESSVFETLQSENR